MSIPIEKLQPGDVLYDVHTTRAGNTTIRIEGVWKARVISVHANESPPYAMVSWNTNTPQKHYYRVPYKRHPKEWVREWGGRKCHYCHAEEADGHRDDCNHPRAVSKRQRAKKAQIEAGGGE